VHRAFWRLIAKGGTTEDAAAEVGVSTPVASRWFRHAGGMSPISLAEPTGRFLCFAEREEISLLNAQGHGVREIARRIGRDPGTVSRELRRNAATRAGQRGYRAGVAQRKAQQAAKRPKQAKLATNPRLREYVEHKLAGAVTDAHGRPISGPNVPWAGRRLGRRQDRRWGVSWSPEQISNRLKVDFPDDESMRISPETIYHLRAQLRGRSLVSQLDRIEKLQVATTASVEERMSVFTLQSIASRIRFLPQQIAELDPQLLDLIKQHPAGPALLAEAGVGPVVAAQLFISWSHHGRVRNEAAFASLAGVAPLETSSGLNSRHRLNRGGDRALNRALHTVAITRMRCHPETRAYEIRRSANGKTHRDVRRSLKRALARRLYRRIESAVRLHEAATAA